MIRFPNIEIIHLILGRGAQIQIKTANRSKKTENRKKPNILDVFGCPFVKTAGSDRILD
jgi:hypothetical protein